MFGLTFLYAFITFIIFISLLIGVGSLVMGSVYKNRSLIFFGFKSLLVAGLAVTISWVLLWSFVKELGPGFKIFAEFLMSIFKIFK
jgi:hypothetical protein